ncbi:MAG TPA: DUF192 domain-containing protein [Deltaproteobacteria bacterium]|nr:DUF192 domain-containing protein [Deltaproteobacteria bacterium]
MVTLLLLACGSKLPVTTLQVGGHPVRAEIAATNAHRQLGLMHRDALATDSGMLFVYPDQQIRGFWMKDTRIPLSIAFADRYGKIVRIADMKPFDTTRISSLAPAMYALEMEQGWFAAHEITKGDTITDLPTDLTVE